MIVSVPAPPSNLSPFSNPLLKLTLSFPEPPITSTSLLIPSESTVPKVKFPLNADASIVVVAARIVAPLSIVKFLSPAITTLVWSAWIFTNLDSVPAVVTFTVAIPLETMLDTAVFAVDFTLSNLTFNTSAVPTTAVASKLSVVFPPVTFVNSKPSTGTVSIASNVRFCELFALTNLVTSVA